MPRKLKLDDDGNAWLKTGDGSFLVGPPEEVFKPDGIQVFMSEEVHAELEKAIMAEVEKENQGLTIAEMILKMSHEIRDSNVGGAPTSIICSSEKEVDMLYRSINPDPHEGKNNV